MGYSNTLGAGLCQYFVEPFISEVSGSHLNANAVPRGIFFGIKMLNLQRDVLFPAEFTYKLLVPVRFFLPEVEITMKRLNLISQVFQD